jgi:hypothetical protein
MAVPNWDEWQRVWTPAIWTRRANGGLAMATIPQVRRLLFSGEEIGMGFNSESGLAAGTALEGFTVGDDAAAGGQEVSASITIVNSHEELMSRLGMAFDAQGRYGFFSASAKAEFSESSSYNSTSTFLVARCVVQNALKRGRGLRGAPIGAGAA